MKPNSISLRTGRQFSYLTALSIDSEEEADHVSQS